MVRHKSIVFFPESIGILNIVVDIKNIGDDMVATAGITMHGRVPSMAFVVRQKVSIIAFLCRLP